MYKGMEQRGGRFLGFFFDDLWCINPLFTSTFVFLPIFLYFQFSPFLTPSSFLLLHPFLLYSDCSSEFFLSLCNSCSLLLKIIRNNLLIAKTKRLTEFISSLVIKAGLFSSLLPSSSTSICCNL